MQILLYIFYLLLACSFLAYYRFHHNTGFSIKVILALFILKVVAGTANMYIHFYVYVTNDIGFFYWQSINELKAMPSDPGKFFYEWLFNWGNPGKGLDFGSGKANVFWKDLGVLFHTKYMTLANILSFGKQYVNVILYNIPFFLGQLFLYKVFYKRTPEKKWLLLLVIFLLPSVLFWCSGIHKDGWILVAVGMMVYHLDCFLHERKTRNLVFFFVFAFFLFVMRYFFLLCMLPSLLAWVWSYGKKHPLKYFGIVYGCAALTFFVSPYLGNRLNLLKLVSARQKEFMKLRGYSDMATPELKDHALSYVECLPSALDHIFTRPRLSPGSPVKYAFSAIDTLLVLGLILFFLFHFKKRNAQEPLYLALFFYAFAVYLFIGYTIPNCGALVRYKSEFTVLLLASLVAMSETPRLLKFLNRKLIGME